MLLHCFLGDNEEDWTHGVPSCSRWNGGAEQDNGRKTDMCREEVAQKNQAND